MIKKLYLVMSLFLATVFMPHAVLAESHLVGQLDKKFTTKKLTINVGDTVTFVNQDPFFHNVYSLSALKFFDLGSFPQGEARSVVFDEPGTVVVECAIHPAMKMVIEIK